MKAYRNIGGQVIEIQVDVDLAGNPILPPDTTVFNKPTIPAGYYATVVGDNWVVLEDIKHVPSLEENRATRLKELANYRTWLLTQPVEHDSLQFDGDELARSRVTQALVNHQALGALPNGWITYDNRVYAIPTVAALEALATSIATTFQTRFFETAAVRESLMDAVDQVALDAIVIPSRPMNNMM